MPVVSKPNTFVAGTTKSGEASQVNADFDTLYNLINGGLDDANIAALAGIQQSKILNLVADLSTLTNRKGWVLIDSKSAANSATIDFTTGIDNTYDSYRIGIVNLVPQTDGTGLYIRVSQSLTFQSGSVYQWVRYGAVAAATPNVSAAGSVSDTQIIPAINIGNATIEGLCGEVFFTAPAGTVVAKLLRWELSYIANSGAVADSRGSGSSSGLFGAIDGIRLLMSSGNIVSGDFRLYGLRK